MTTNNTITSTYSITTPNNSNTTSIDSTTTTTTTTTISVVTPTLPNDACKTVNVVPNGVFPVAYESVYTGYGSKCFTSLRIPIEVALASSLPSASWWSDFADEVVWQKNPLRCLDNKTPHNYAFNRFEDSTSTDTLTARTNPLTFSGTHLSSTRGATHPPLTTIISGDETACDAIQQCSNIACHDPDAYFAIDLHFSISNNDWVCVQYLAAGFTAGNANDYTAITDSDVSWVFGYVYTELA